MSAEARYAPSRASVACALAIRACACCAFWTLPEPLSGQIGVALVLLRGEGHRGLVDIDGGLRGVDHRLLDLELGLLAGDRGPGRRHIRPGLVERDPEVAVVDPGQHLAGCDALIVLDQHLLQIAGDLWRDGGVVGLHIGVVGRHQILADGPVVPAIPGGARQHGDRRAGE